MIVASYIAGWTDIDEVWLTLSPENPLKRRHDGATDADRLSMLRTACGNSDTLKVCDVELGMPRPSYTVNTLRFLRDRYPECDFTLIIGSDNWKIFDRWHAAEEIIKEFGVTVYPRPGYPVDSRTLPEGVAYADAPTVSLSSTFLRQAISLDMPVRHMVPDGVEQYILQERLYKNRNMKLNNNALSAIALANEYCQALELATSVSPREFVLKMTRILPRIYIAVSDIPASADDDSNDMDFGFDSIHLDETYYNEIRDNIAAVMGEHDTYLETFHEDMKYSDTPIAATVSESLADLFQVLYNFVEDVREADPDQALGYLTDLRRQFAEYWGGTLCNVMRPLNHYIHHTEDEDDEEDFI